MWLKFVHFIHHIFNPHCLECDAKQRCESCKQLLLIIENERRDKYKLIEHFTAKPVIAQDEPKELPQPIGSFRTWDAKRHSLELAERQKHLTENEQANIRLKAKTTEELEAELLVND